MGSTCGPRHARSLEVDSDNKKLSSQEAAPMRTPIFPAELLDDTLDARLAYFKDCVVTHQLIKPIQDLVDSLWPTSRSTTTHQEHVLIFGHTGTGKSSFVAAMETHYPRTPAHEVEIIPFLRFNIPSSCTPKEIYIEALRAYTQVAPSDAVIIHDEATVRKRESGTEGALKRRLFDYALQCRTLVWNMDEIQHIQHAGRFGFSIPYMLDMIKHIADEAGVMLLMTGTPDTPGMFALSPQLARRFRRKRLMHYQNFDPRCPNAPDTLYFVELLQTLEDRLPLQSPSNLILLAPMLYQYSLGFIGLLKPWLTRALKVAIITKQDRVTKAILERTRWSDEELEEFQQKIEREAKVLRLSLEATRAITESTDDTRLSKRRSRAN